MSCLLKICAIIASLLLIDTVQTSPIFQGFSIQKGFEVKLKPFEFKPFSFFKEKWSPFGRFGVRKGIQKRDLRARTEELLPPRPAVVPPAPVFEVFEDVKQEDRKENVREAVTELQPGPDPIKPISSNMIRIPLSESFKPQTEGLYTSIGRNPSVVTKPKPLEQIFGELPSRPVGPVPEPVEVSPQPISVLPIPSQPIPSQPMPVQPFSPLPVEPVTPIPFRPVTTNSLQPISPLIWTGGRPENSIEPGPVPVWFQPAGQNVQSPVSQVVPLITPPPQPPVSPIPNAPISEIPPTDGPIVRGSKVALYFGNVLLQLVSQFLTNARAQFSQFRQSPLPQMPPLPVPISNN